MMSRSARHPYIIQVLPIWHCPHLTCLSLTSLLLIGSLLIHDFKSPLTSIRMAPYDEPSIQTFDTESSASGSYATPYLVVDTTEPSKTTTPSLHVAIYPYIDPILDAASRSKYLERIENASKTLSTMIKGNSTLRYPSQTGIWLHLSKESAAESCRSQLMNWKTQLESMSESINRSGGEFTGLTVHIAYPEDWPGLKNRHKLEEAQRKTLARESTMR